AGARGGDAQGAGLTGGAQAERLGGIRVDDAGLVRLPYAGPIRAAGRTPGELALQIRAGLKGLSQNPQVVVAISQTIANSVIVGGEVGRPGRLVLATNRETLSDAVALAGGYRGEAKDLAVRVVRAGRALEYRLADVLSAPARDMRVAPGDRIEVLRQPFSFAVMGAAGKVEQMAFSGPGVSLAEAVAMAGGAHPALGDAKAVFVFRFVADGAGGEKPVVYHLDMMRGGAYFLSQRFAMRDKDLLFIGNAAANQPTKLIQLVSQLFTPIVAVESGLVTTGALR
ncbi:MAG TPA: polysaccharide biosynthesis/export family protein, partial [Novosphingobium sp.]|nr:polysaccharide biosynthesis/export family protein [Novosphingobium sp.]